MREHLLDACPHELAPSPHCGRCPKLRNAKSHVRGESGAAAHREADWRLAPGLGDWASSRLLSWCLL